MKVHKKKVIPKVTSSYEATATSSTDKKPNVVETPISINDKATKRVIAPFVKIVRKGQKLIPEAEDTAFSLYLQKKPSVLIRDLSLFISDSVDLYPLLHESANVLKRITKASGVTLYMIDPAANEIFLSMRNGCIERFKIRWKIRDGTTIAAFVANRKEYVLVEDILLDERFPEGVGYEGETVKSVLCVPIVTPDKECFAIIELYRQLFDEPFAEDDLSITIVVTGWMGAAIHQNQQRLALQRQQELNDYLLDLTTCYFSETGVLLEKMIVEVIMYLNNCYRKMLHLQQTPCIHDFQDLSENLVIDVPPDFDKFSWYISTDLHDKMPQMCYHMFSKIIGICNIKEENMMKFILSTRKVYRNVPYHNFEHAFNVLHCMHLILQRNIFRFSATELKALMVAALGHDLDHGGLTNNFLQLTNHDLANLYEESFLENHHYEVAMFILKDNEVYQNCSQDEFRLLSEEIKQAILATDLALHFKTRTKLQQIVQEQTFNWSEPSHRTLVKSVMMTSCDLSGQCKPFLTARRITENVYREFYAQGDLEKQMGLCPISTMDREKQHCVPEDQVQFLSIIVIPCVHTLQTVFPNTADLHNAAILLRKTWQDVIDVRGMKCWRQDDSIVYK